MKGLKLICWLAALGLIAFGCAPKEGDGGTTGTTETTTGGTESTTGGETNSNTTAKGIPWAASYDEAVATAKADNKLVMLKFTAEW